MSQNPLIDDTLIHDALTHEEGCDYILNEDNCWIAVENLSVQLRKQDEGLSIYVYPLHREYEDSITETWVLWTEGAEE